MVAVFTGDLSQIRLLDILNLLIHERKTGKVTLKRGSTIGEIFVEEGRIIHGGAESHNGEEAVYLMMTWMIGQFSYTPDVLPDSKTIETPTEQIISEGVQRVEEWDRIRKTIPSTDIAFRLSSWKSADDIVLKADEWNVIIRLNGVKDVRQISRELGIDEIRTAKKLFRLLEKELIEVAARPPQPPKKIVGKVFFERVQVELTQIMGPIAPVIIDDTVAEMDEKISAFPKDRAAELVERVSSEISDEGKRLDFQKLMLEVLKKI
ncbi:MAG: DUF4388 domain-containing protein [Proteobacteria bacterium]|nr:DUF4388 domain-containing protein [Pseudomonadota bacterium]NIS69457.1 DUF4388 domain-containing protein [Pseudomonadota bacterium]